MASVNQHDLLHYCVLTLLHIESHQLHSVFAQARRLSAYACKPSCNLSSISITGK